MAKSKDFYDTLSDMSVEEILEGINMDVYSEDGEVSLEEILSEYSGVPREEMEIVRAPKEPKTSDTKPPEREDELRDEIPKENEVKMVDTIIRPWENGMYGDMLLEEEKQKEKKKKKQKAKLSETLDTFTRSELFEERGTAEPLETRTAEEILEENARISRFLGLRVILLLILGVLSCYLAFSEPLSWYLPRFISYIVHPFRYLFLTAFFQICAMLLAVDVISKGLASLFTLHQTMESAIAFSSFSTLIHVITIMVAPHWRGWLPYSCITVVSLFFVIYSKWVSSRSLRRVCKTVKSAKSPSTVHVADNFGETAIIKQTADDTASFISHINDNDASKTFWTFLSPLTIVAAIVFAVISSVGAGVPEHFFWALAAVSSVSMPFFATLSFVHPFSIVTKTLSSIGVALSGWFSATNLSKRANFIVCDEDIFPKGTITLHGLRVLGSFSLEQTVSYTASVISETKSGLSGVFGDLLKSRYGETTKVRNLKYHETGGIEATVGEDNVLVGGAGFMLRSGIRLSSGTNSKNAVFVAINKEPAGVFNINYKANVEVERALHALVRKKVPVILAVRDFNLLPMMVEQVFGLRDGSLEYPEVEDRINLSSDNQLISEDAAVVITRSGLYPFASAVLSAKRLRKATIRNICLTAACSIVGMLLMFYLTFMQRPILITPHTVFVYMMMWFLPTFMLSRRVKR